MKIVQLNNGDYVIQQRAFLFLKVYYTLSGEWWFLDSGTYKSRSLGEMICVKNKLNLCVERDVSNEEIKEVDVKAYTPRQFVEISKRDASTCIPREFV